MYYLPILFLSFALAIAIAAFARERRLRRHPALLLRLLSDGGIAEQRCSRRTLITAMIL
jgi:hypothetical protein